MIQHVQVEAHESVHHEVVSKETLRYTKDLDLEGLDCRPH